MLGNNTETLGYKKAILHRFKRENAGTEQKRRGKRFLAINSPEDCRRKGLLQFELREHGRIRSNYKCQK